MLLSGSTVCANLLLGPANIPDLLDSEVGADNGGHQPDTQPAMEKETGEQQHPESNSDGPPQDQKVSLCVSQLGY